MYLASTQKTPMLEAMNTQMNIVSVLGAFREQFDHFQPQCNTNVNEVAEILLDEAKWEQLSLNIV